MTAVSPYYGARWWKFDFHNHTPKSDDYGKGPNQTALKARTPRDWLLDYMLAGFDCVAITDHNSGAWIDDLKAELSRMDVEKPGGYRPLVLFPGVEISVHGGIHVLALFDPGAGGSKIVALLSKCQFEGEYGKTDNCTRKSCAEVIESVIEEGGIPLLAHADSDSGCFQSQTGTTLKQTLQSDGLLAMELVNPAFALPTLYSQLRANLTSVIGSDAHHPTTVGTRYTWVKMEAPTLDALRLALHDGDDGVKRSDETMATPNDIGSRFYLRSMTVSSGAKIGNGQPLTLTFSPWLTTVIGGRGSGKSSILDFLRIAMGRTDGMPPEVKSDFDAFNCIPRGRGDLGMLRGNTTVRLELSKDGRDIALIWQSGIWNEEERAADGSWLKTGNPGDVPKRFPLRIFSQKQLYEMTKQPDVLLDLIDERWDKRSWLEERAFLGEEWLRVRRELRQKTKEIAAVAATRAELADVNAKIRIFEDSGHKDILSLYQTVQTAKQALDSKELALEQAAETFENLQSKIPAIVLEEPLRNIVGEASAASLNIVLTEYGKLLSRLSELLPEFHRVRGDWATTIAAIPWKKEYDSACHKYEDLKENLKNAGGADISGYPGLVEQRAELERKVRRLSEHEEALTNLQRQSTEIEQKIEAHERRLRAERRQVISKWVQPGSGERVRVTLEEMGNLTAAERELRELIRKPGEEFANDIYRSSDGAASSGLLAELLEKAPSSNRWEKLKEIRSTLLQASASNSNGLDRRFGRHLEQMRANTPDDLDRLAIWVPSDKLKLELIKANGNVEDIETGSAGQRTAGLLGLILSLDDSPLVIDQPEDDLETRLISSLVVAGLRLLKQHQQTIVVTHNPNIPVNAAAEQIVEMRFINGQIWTGAVGALQKGDIRRAVCEIMEGGKEALDKRYFRISRALN